MCHYSSCVISGKQKSLEHRLLGHFCCTPSKKQSIPLSGLKGKNSPKAVLGLISWLFSYRHKTITENETSSSQKSDVNNDYPSRNCGIEHTLLGVSGSHCTASLGPIYKHVNKVYGFHWWPHLYSVLISLAMNMAVGFFEEHPYNVAAVSVTLRPRQRKDCPEGEKKECVPTFSTVT